MRDMEQAGFTLQTKPNPVRFSQGWPNPSLYTHIFKQEINAYFCKPRNTGVVCHAEMLWKATDCYHASLIMGKRLLVRDFVQNSWFVERVVDVKKIDQIMIYAWYQLERLNLHLRVFDLGRKEPGRLQSMGLQRVRHDWVTNTHTHNRLVPNRKRSRSRLYIVTLHI